MNAPLALLYVRDYNEIIFPVHDIQQAITLATCIADSDLLNNKIDFNMFDVFLYNDGQLGETWEAPDGETFEDVWVRVRGKVK